MAVGLIVSLFLVVFIIVFFVMLVFVIAHCRNMHNIAPHGATAAEALITSSVVVIFGLTDQFIFVLQSKGKDILNDS